MRESREFRLRSFCCALVSPPVCFLACCLAGFCCSLAGFCCSLGGFCCFLAGFCCSLAGFRSSLAGFSASASFLTRFSRPTSRVNQLQNHNNEHYSSYKGYHLTIKSKRIVEYVTMSPLATSWQENIRSIDMAAKARSSDNLRYTHWIKHKETASLTDYWNINSENLARSQILM